MIYSGSTKIGELYYGNQKIKEAYYGDIKVYTNFVGLPVWEFTGSGYQPLYLFGEYSTSGIACPGGTGGQTPVVNLTGTLKTISGTLGQSGSSITINATGNSPPTGSFSYEKTITSFGKKIYQYRTVPSWTFDVYLYEDSVVGDTILCSCNFGDTQVISLTDSQIVATITFNNVTYTRNGSYLKYWNKDGLT